MRKELASTYPVFFRGIRGVIMKIAVCDDEKEACAELRRLIRRERPDAEVVCFCSCRQLLMSGQRFPIVFMDVRTEGASGIEAAKALRRKDEAAVLIFVTALKEYVFEAFDVSAFHYLLKPVSEDKFREVFAKAWEEADRREQKRGEQVFFRTKSRSFTVPQKDILYVESRGRKVDIHTLRECVTVYATMNGLEEQLGSPFYRCHRGYLVNLARVAEYETDKILLENGETVLLAREKYAEFDRTYLEYLKSEGKARIIL